jgi:hypothetical protein
MSDDQKMEALRAILSFAAARGGDGPVIPESVIRALKVLFPNGM